MSTNNKTKRRSFFFFGSISGNSPSHSRTISNDNSSTNRRQDTLSNHHNRSSSSATPSKTNKTTVATDKASRIKVPTRIIEQTKINATEPLTGTQTTSLDPKRALQNRRRPPPPPLNLPLATGKKISREDDLVVTRTDSSVRTTPRQEEPEHREATRGHTRQLSEAEKLVDDIDMYIKQHKENSASPEIPTGRISDTEPVVIDDPLLMDMVIKDNDQLPESPGIEIQPLNISAAHTDEEDAEALTKQYSLQQNKEDVDDTDDISFSGPSINGSVNSIQQVQIDDKSGPKPVNYSLNYNNNTSSHSIQKSATGSNNAEFIDMDIPANRNSYRQLSKQSSQGGMISPKSSTSEDTTRNCTSYSESSKSLEEPRRFRVANEVRPNFYLHDDEDSFEARSNTTEEHQQCYNDTGSEQSLSIRSSSNSQQNITKTPTAYRSSPSSIDCQTVSIPSTTNLYQLSEESGKKNSSNEKFTSTPSLHTTNTSSTTTSSQYKGTSLISGYVEELRLKYYPTSNFLQAPPDLPATLKQKNNLIQPKNIKVKIRTNSRQVGIKHGRTKPKLLSLETAGEEHETDKYSSFGSGLSGINVNHTKEFHNLISKNANTIAKETGDEDSYMKDIPGDDAYDSDDMMAPLREKDSQIVPLTRTNTAVSYFTRNKNRLRSGTLENNYAQLQRLPTEILLEHNQSDQVSNDFKETASISSYESEFQAQPYNLHVANPDSDKD